MLAEYPTSERHICGLIEVPRPSCRYQNRRDDRGMSERLLELAWEHPQFGYRRLHVLLEREQLAVNHKKVRRVCRQLGLTVKRNRRKCLHLVLKPRPLMTAPNQGWSLDFVSDVTGAGQRFRGLSVVDNFTRQSLVLDTDTSFPSRRVTRALEKPIDRCRKPEAIRCDNGPEMSSRHFLAWCIDRKIDLVHIQPAGPRRMHMWRAPEAGA